MCVELEARGKDGLSVLLALGAANALIWMCVMTFPESAHAQRAATQAIDTKIQSQVDEIEERQIDNRMDIAVLTERLGAMERSQREINQKLDTIITGIVALFGTVLSGCVVAFFSLKMGWMSAKA